MRIEAENFGAILILHFVDKVTPQDIQQFLEEAPEKCKAASYLILSLDRSDAGEAVFKTLIGVRESQRYSKPNVCLVSSRLAGADAPNVAEALKLLESPDAKLITKIAATRQALAGFNATKDDVELQIRKLLGLNEGYTQDDLDEAKAAALEKRAELRHLATTRNAQVAEMRKTRTALTAESRDPEREKLVANTKDKMYSTVRGD